MGYKKMEYKKQVGVGSLGVLGNGYDEEVVDVRELTQVKAKKKKGGCVGCIPGDCSDCIPKPGDMFGITEEDEEIKYLR